MITVVSFSNCKLSWSILNLCYKLETSHLDAERISSRLDVLCLIQQFFPSSLILTVVLFACVEHTACGVLLIMLLYRVEYHSFHLISFPSLTDRLIHHKSCYIAVSLSVLLSFLYLQTYQTSNLLTSCFHPSHSLTAHDSSDCFMQISHARFYQLCFPLIPFTGHLWNHSPLSLYSPSLTP